MWENIRKQYKNNKLKIIALAQNHEFELPYGSYYFQVFKTIFTTS